MSNQYYTHHPELKNGSPTKPATSKDTEAQAGYHESAKAWPAPPAGRGPKFNKVGFRKVKAYVSEKIND